MWLTCFASSGHVVGLHGFGHIAGTIFEAPALRCGGKDRDPESAYRQIQEDSTFRDDRLPHTQQTRRDELLERMRAQTEPPRAFEVEIPAEYTETVHRDRKAASGSRQLPAPSGGADPGQDEESR